MKRSTISISAMMLLASCYVQSAEEPPVSKPREQAKGDDKGVLDLSGLVVSGSATLSDDKSRQSFDDASAKAYCDELGPSVQLSAAQKSQIREIIKARNKSSIDAVINGNPAREAALSDLRRAAENRDDDAAAKARAACDRAFASEREAYKKAEDNLVEVLTPKQRFKVMFNRASEWTKILVAPAVLSDAQAKKAKTVCEEIAKGGYPAIETSLPNDIGQLLTSAQFKSIFKFRATGDLDSLCRHVNLSSEQKKRAAALIEEMAGEPNIVSDWPTFESHRERLYKKINENLTAVHRKSLAPSSSYSTDFRRPTWGRFLGGPTVDVSGSVLIKP